VRTNEPVTRACADRKILSLRDMWLVGAGVLVVAVALAVWRAANGAGTSTAVLAGLSVVFMSTVALTVNQLAARRRARRRTSA